MRLRGYRKRDAHMLSGYWVPGQLVSTSDEGRDAMLVPHTFDLRHEDPTTRLLVAEETALVRFSDIDPIHRRARLCVALVAGAQGRADAVLSEAIRVGFGQLNLHRLHGRVITGAGHSLSVARAGFRFEGVVPRGQWFGGGERDVETWGVLRDDR